MATTTTTTTVRIGVDPTGNRYATSTKNPIKNYYPHSDNRRKALAIRKASAQLEKSKNHVACNDSNTAATTSETS